MEHICDSYEGEGMVRGEFSVSRREALRRETKENDEKTNASLHIGGDIVASRKRTLDEIGRIANMLTEVEDRKNLERAQQEAMREAKQDFQTRVEHPVNETTQQTENIALEAANEAEQASKQANDVRGLAGSSDYGKAALSQAASKLDVASRFNIDTSEQGKRSVASARERLRQMRSSLDS